MKKLALTVLLCLLALPQICLAHSAGAIDSYGCHPDRRKGNYHCHRGPMDGMVFKSKAEMLKQRAAGTIGKQSQATGSSQAPGAPAGSSRKRLWWLPSFLQKKKQQQPAPVPEGIVVPSGIMNRLRTLKQIHDEQLITDEEYDAKRKEILGEL